MNRIKIFGALGLVAIALASLSFVSKNNPAPKSTATSHKGCVFRSVFEAEGIDSAFIYKTPEKVKSSIDGALQWMSKAQLTDGGWGAGTHARQSVYDPHAVSSDPATTAMVAMALLRAGNTPTSGKYAANLSLATDYLLKQVDQADENALNITTLSGTQPQVKLGQNIDVVLTTQYLTNLLDYTTHNPGLKSRVKKCLDKCVVKIQQAQNQNGSIKGAGWAGVLQSSFAANALESAKAAGAKVDDKKLEAYKNYQKKNYDVGSGSVATADGAGVMLYSISGTARSSAQEASVAKEKIKDAINKGTLPPQATVTNENLRAAGMTDAEAYQYATAYEINQSALKKAQRNDVMNGFGSNGGEEFLSYLQTGEGLIVSRDQEWQKWYDNVSGRLLEIQNNDGSWNGHHCITSPVFCTATSLLILSINNDIERLQALSK
jgi:prenyltransferase beta subunit